MEPEVEYPHSTRSASFSTVPPPPRAPPLSISQATVSGPALSNHDCSKQDVEQTKITPIQYEPDFPFKYNNFVYRLSLPTDISGGLGDADESRKLKQPGCVPIPAGTREFILRFSNPDAEGMHQETRVQNEVGILTLASAALRHIKPTVVPRVFGWGGASREHPGWILQELMPGALLAETYSKTMSLDQKKGILAQMAGLLKALQDYPLPESIKGWGGVTFDESGAIVSAPMTSVGAGPWPSLEDSFRGRLKVALTKADKNPYLKGWRANGVRERVDAFIEHGLPAQFSDLTSKQDKTIIHADFGGFLIFLFAWNTCYYFTLRDPSTDTETKSSIIYSTTLRQAVLERFSTTTSPASYTLHTSSSALLPATAASLPAGWGTRLHRKRRRQRFGMPNLLASSLRLFQLR